MKIAVIGVERGAPRPAPLPLWKREGPTPQAWEGEGETPRLPTHAKLLVRTRWRRQNPTNAERRLWAMMRARRLPSFKFKRQQIIFPFIVDFVTFQRRVIIEADGSQHAENWQDARRDAVLRRDGFRLLRFWNNDVLSRSGDVAEAIDAALSPSPSQACGLGPSLSRKGRGAADGASPNA